MANRMRNVRAVAVSIALAGCSATAPARFYTLDSTATADPSASATYAVVVGPVDVPSTVDRPQFVVQVAPNRVEMNEFNRWAAPLDESIARTVAGDLVALLGTPDVFTGPAANVTPVYRVSIDVQRFESVQGKTALVEATWTVRGAADRQTRTGRTVARESVSDPGFDALAAAHSRALARLSTDIAGEIRALAASPTKAADVAPAKRTR